MSFTIVLALAALTGQQIQGAASVLDAVHTKSKPNLAPRRAYQSLVDVANNYTATSNSMTVPRAADGYMRLLTRWESDANSGIEQDNLIQDFPIDILPRPEAWPAIRDRLTKRPKDKKNDVLILLFDLLLGRDAQVIRACNRIKGPSQFTQSDNSSTPIAEIEFPIAVRTRNSDLTTSILNSTKNILGVRLWDEIPDLVSIFGPAKARPMLKAMLEASQQTWYQIKGKQTKALARSVMFEDRANLKNPNYELAESVEDILRLKAIYPRSETAINGPATDAYTAYLLRNGKFDETADSSGEVTDPSFFSALGALLAKHPLSQFWVNYADIGMRIGKLSEVRERMQAAVNRTSDPKNRRYLLMQQCEVEARAGSIETAREAIIEASKIPPPIENYESYRLNLLKFAEATDSKEALDAAIVAAKPKPFSTSDLVSDLAARGRIADAQNVLLESAAATKSDRDNSDQTTLAVQFAEIYYRANKPQEVVNLLESFPFWKTDDLYHEVNLRNQGNEEHAYLPLGYYAAWAFAQTGRKPLAIRTLHDVLFCDLKQDDSFELLNRLEGVSALTFYNSLIASDPFATRPIAWKADLLLKLGRVSEAEKLARAAVSKDPTDGDAPRGRRLMSYTVLAHILRAAGKTSEAENYENIVASVRLGEKGDAYREVGLIPQALEQYQKAAKLFANAYCIRMRMAAALAQSGDTKAALEQYKRAYELMPASFGEISTLCYGCEGAWSTPQSSGIALSVFENLVKTAPKNAGNWYALGQTYENANETKNALHAYEQAAKVDPRYLNAWEQIVEIGDQSAGGMPLLKRAAEVVTELDPNSHHVGTHATRYISDYKRLWRIYEKADRSELPDPNPSLYLLKKAKPNQDPSDGNVWTSEAGPSVSPFRHAPGAWMTGVEQIAAVFQLYQNQPH